jgi:hypothetical protein
MGYRTVLCKVLVGRADGKTPLGTPRLRWEDNIETDLQHA